MDKIAVLAFIAILLAAVFAAPAEKEQEKSDLVASDKEDLKAAASHWGGFGHGGYGGYYGGYYPHWGGYGGYGGYGWGWPSYGYGYGYGWPYGHYGHHNYWW